MFADEDDGRVPTVRRGHGHDLRRLPMLVVTIAAARRRRARRRDGRSCRRAPCSPPSARRGCRQLRSPVDSPAPGSAPACRPPARRVAAGSSRVFNSGEAALRGRLTVLRVDGEPVTQDIEVPPFASAGVRPRHARRLAVRRGVRRDRRRRRPRRATRRRSGRASRSRPVPTPAPRRGTSPPATRSTAASKRSCCPTPTTIRRSSTSRLATERGVRVPEQYQNFAVPAQSVRVIDVGTAIIGDQTRIGVSVVATRGRVVVGRSQLLDTPDRTGYVMTLAAPAARDQWWFVYGERADNVVENYYLYNPGDEDAEVTPVLLGFQQPAGMEPPETIVVPDGEVVEFRMADVADLPAGRTASCSAPSRRRRSSSSGCSPARSTRWRRPRSRSGRRHGPTATSPTRGTSASARRSPPSGRWRCTTTPRRRPSSRCRRSRPQGVQNVAGFADVAVAAGAIRYLDITDAARRQPADRALDDAAVRRTGPAPRTRRPRPRRRLGRPRQRLSIRCWSGSPSRPRTATAGSPALGSVAVDRWIALLIALGIAVLGGRRGARVAAAADARRADPGDGGRCPTSSTAPTSPSPEAPVARRRVHVGDVRDAAPTSSPRPRCWRAPRSPSTIVEYPGAARRAPALRHRRRAPAR